MRTTTLGSPGNQARYTALHTIALIRFHDAESHFVPAP
jgi:hypothetical protein